jgi:hypothetical protein
MYRWAKAWAILFCALVFGSASLIMLESLPRCHHDAGSSFCKHLPTVHHVLTGIFLLELLVRISCFPSVKDCLLDGYTWVDLVSLLPDCLGLVRLLHSAHFMTRHHSEKSQVKPLT